MQVEAGDEEFIRTKLGNVEGWLMDEGAYLTSALLRAQGELGIDGCIFEIGVFAGKYLSLLYHLSSVNRETVIGMDTFEWYPSEWVERNLRALFGDLDRLKLITKDSTKVILKEFQASLPNAPRFISVDGAHTSPAVLHDLELSEALLAPGGIVAIDDFLNCRAIGVSEGAYRYLLKRSVTKMVPFIFCANKLFVCRIEDVAYWRSQGWKFAESNPTLPMCIEFDKLLKKGRSWVEQELLGQPVLIF